MCVCLRGNSLCVSNNKSKRAAATTDIGLLTTTCVINPGGLFGYPPLPANSEKEQYAARRDIQIPRRGGEAVKFIAFLFLKNFRERRKRKYRGQVRGFPRTKREKTKLKRPWKLCFFSVCFFSKMKEEREERGQSKLDLPIAPTYCCYLTSVCLRHVYTMCFEFILQKIRNTCLFCPLPSPPSFFAGIHACVLGLCWVRYAPPPSPPTLSYLKIQDGKREEEEEEERGRALTLALPFVLRWRAQIIYTRT